LPVSQQTFKAFLKGRKREERGLGFVVCPEKKSNKVNRITVMTQKETYSALFYTSFDIRHYQELVQNPVNS